MRRVTDQEWKASEELEVPAGWDAWLYFPLINRDPKRYGADARVFRAERWKDADLPEPVSFGHGGKICLGRSVVRKIVSIVLEEIQAGAQMEILSQLEESMCDFLGWQLDEGHRQAQMWGSIKQLPVQRPKEPVMVALHVTHESNSMQ
ncbi:hypothetical protein JCM24511_02121 [Saitozyma sp. JCM 24511]|nr:hypothetical protein JCM24511_02121 [Saitozyma sp. JCM 24511]